MIEERRVTQEALVRLLSEAMAAYAEYEKLPTDDLNWAVFCAHYVWERLPLEGGESEAEPYVAG